jgi:iron complex outermembrane receptor protein
MKKLLGTMLFIAVGCISSAQSSLTDQFTGIVKDATTRQPIAGATVWLANKPMVTDEKGVFVVSRNALAGKKLVIAATGYRNIQQDKLTISAATMEWFLTPVVETLQPLEVTAVRASDRAPFAKSNISKEELKKLNLGMDIPYILNQLPSVVVNSDAGNGVGYTGIRIRGSDATRINVTLNGIPYNDAESMGTFFVNLPDFTSSVNSIQVQRGVGTSSNGPAAFGASVHLSTNDIKEKPYLEFNNSIGSFGTFKHTLQGGTGVIGKYFTIDGRVSTIRSNGYIDRASSDLRSFYVGTVFRKGNTSLRFNVFSGNEKTYQAWYGVSESMLATNRRFNPAGTEKPGEPYENQTDNYHQTHYQLFFNQQLKNNWTLNTTTFLSRGKGYYEEYRADQSLARYGLPPFTSGGITYTRTDLVRQLWLDNYYYGQLFTLQKRTDKKEVTMGGGVTRYDGDHIGRLPWLQRGIQPANYRFYDLPAFKNDAHLYIKWQQNFSSRWKGFADLQQRLVRHVMDGFRNNPTLRVDRSFSFFNPKLGLSYQNGGTQAFFSFAVANKEPNRDDFQAGINSQPKSERLLDWEAGWLHRTEKSSIGVTLFHMDYRDQLVLTGQINDVGAYTRTNVPRSFRTGIEIEGGIRLRPSLQLNGNLTISRNKIKQFTEFIDNFDTGDQDKIVHRNKDISFSPPVTANATLNWKPLPALEVEWLHKFVDRQFLDNTSNAARQIAAFYVQDVRINWKVPVKTFKETRLVVQVFNVLNRMYAPNGYTYPYVSGGSLIADNYFYPVAGTHLMAALNISF